MKKLFGTDGIRGIAGQDLTAEIALALGKAAGHFLGKESGEKPCFIVGKDPRESSAMLEAAVAAGISAAGGNVLLLGEVPTPAVSALVVEKKAAGGVMISASHNPFAYNGLKVFDRNGVKLDEAEEERLEALLRAMPFETAPSAFGKVENAAFASRRYVEKLAFGREGRYAGMRIALDCANGGTSAFAKAFFERLGCETAVLSAAPSGRNINENCGSTHMETLTALVRQGAFDAGFAFDGDGDRCLAVDETGGLFDGDKILAVLAMDRLAKNTLPDRRIVTTVMANFGFHTFAKKANLSALVAGVGDRRVLSMMQKEGAILGGEQSGHIISADYLPTGDGMLTASLLLEAMHSAEKPLSALGAVMQPCPQVLINVPVPNGEKEHRMGRALLRQGIVMAEAELHETGRVLVRPSGTEPLIRVMVEGCDLAMVERLAENIAKTLA